MSTSSFTHSQAPQHTLSHSGAHISSVGISSIFFYTFPLRVLTRSPLFRQQLRRYVNILERLSPLHFCVEAARHSPPHTSCKRIFLHEGDVTPFVGALAAYHLIDVALVPGYAAFGDSNGVRTRDLQRDRLAL